MAISLVKGGNVSLSKEAPGLEKLFVGLGWDPRSTDGAKFDLDASAFMITAEGKVRGSKDFIFFNNLVSSDGSVEHKGDNLTGEGYGDDEVVNVDLLKVPADIDKIVFGVTIYDAASRKQNFGMVSTAFIRVCNQVGDEEIVRFDLSEDYSTETAMVFGELYRHDGGWKFKAIGQGFNDGLPQMAASFGA